MQALEVCPRCDHDFLGGKAVVSGGMRLGYYRLHDKGPVVRCPHCLHVFKPENLRLFGFLHPDAVCWVVPAILAVCVGIAFVQKNWG
ncbi:DNA-directed RNA polymerase subunit RPC12/RpoP [Roseateles terrae]|uniref:DNA-directed RNA polymerase subunit RPC12/RpoP n=1 Tax=Roseateles terrae TaxID=431060 RepID=A0ABR6GYU1_9BURK|nr:DNA-directed RNA polymerase subunit RPC12/RpoP [Roseateles terrae]